MKIKRGFVTNSSSTSFIVFCTRKLEDDDWKYLVDGVRIAKRLANDFKDADQFIIDDSQELSAKIADVLISGTIIGLPYDLPRDYKENNNKLHDINRKETDPEKRSELIHKYFEEVENEHRKECIELAKKIIRTHMGEVAYIVSYASDSGDHLSAKLRRMGRDILCRNVFISGIEIDNS